MSFRVLPAEVVASLGADGSIAAEIAELSILDGAATSVELAVLSVSVVHRGWIVWLLPSISRMSSLVHTISAGFLLIVTVLFEMLFEIPPFLVAFSLRHSWQVLLHF